MTVGAGGKRLRFPGAPLSARRAGGLQSGARSAERGGHFSGEGVGSGRGCRRGGLEEARAFARVKPVVDDRGLCRIIVSFSAINRKDLL
jgi:hypothetical protein